MPWWIEVLAEALVLLRHRQTQRQKRRLRRDHAQDGQWMLGQRQWLQPGPSLDSRMPQ
jgi:hypothetical protein